MTAIPALLGQLGSFVTNIVEVLHTRTIVLANNVLLPTKSIPKSLLKNVFCWRSLHTANICWKTLLAIYFLTCWPSGPGF